MTLRQRPPKIIQIKSRFKATHAIVLWPKEKAMLWKPVVGDGGFQRFMKKLQSQFDGITLFLTDADFGKAIRYARYDAGGYEGRIARILNRPIHAALNQARQHAA